MRDPLDAKLRELAIRLVEMSPEAPPFPESPTAQLQRTPGTASAPPPRRRSPLVWAGAAALAVLLLVGLPLVILLATRDPEPDPVGTTQPSVTVAPPTTSITPTTEPTPQTTVAPVGPTGVGVKVYLFSGFATKADGSPGLVPVGRFLDYDEPDQVGELEIISRTLGVLVNDGVRASDPEGVHTEIPAGIREVGIADQGDGVLQVDLPGAFAGGGGSATMFGRLAQVVYTATQFPSVNGVTFALDGQPIEVFSTEGIVLDGPQTRDGYRDQLPPIFVDDPAFGATVSSPFIVSGEAQVAGAEFLYRLEGGGAVLSEGVAATAPGEWGEFAFEVSYGIDTQVVAQLLLFEESSEDGAIVDPVIYTITLEPTGGTAPPTQGGSFTIDNAAAAITAVPLDGELVVDAAYGSAPDQLGLATEQRLGPCCFDVAGDGTVVILDPQNSRISAWPVDADPFVLSEFDSADIVPESLAVAGDRVVIAGRTGRGELPYDIISLDLATGALIQRAEALSEIEFGLREAAGRVFAEPPLPSGQQEWAALTERSGALLERDQLTLTDVLPTEPSLRVFATMSDGVEVTANPLGGGPSSKFTFTWAPAIVDVFGYPGFPDGVLVTSHEPGSPDGVMAAIVAGTDAGVPVTGAYLIPVQRWSELGSFNLARYRAGFLYVLSSTATGVEITRYEIPHPSAQQPVTAEDEGLIRAFVEFARNPNAATAAALPFADTVRLGLGPALYVDASRSELTEPAMWTIDVEAFRAYVGPFSILEVAAADTTLEISVGPHNHCAGPPMPPPAGLETARRVSAQNVEGDSCLQWSTFDLFLDEAGEIVAVTMDLWEP